MKVDTDDCLCCDDEGSECMNAEGKDCKICVPKTKPEKPTTTPATTNHEDTRHDFNSKQVKPSRGFTETSRQWIIKYIEKF